MIRIGSSQKIENLWFLISCGLKCPQYFNLKSYVTHVSKKAFVVK